MQRSGGAATALAGQYKQHVEMPVYLQGGEAQNATITFGNEACLVLQAFMQGLPAGNPRCPGLPLLGGIERGAALQYRAAENAHECGGVSHLVIAYLHHRVSRYHEKGRPL